MKNTQHIKVSKAEYAALQRELESLRAEAVQHQAEKAALAQALQRERDRLRKVIKEFVKRRSERYKAPVINEEQLSLFADQFVTVAKASGKEADAAPAGKKTTQARRQHPGRRPVPQYPPYQPHIAQATFSLEL
jgi:hypothetical protein